MHNIGKDIMLTLKLTGAAKRTLAKMTVVAAGAALAACSTDSYPGLEYDKPDHVENTEAYDKTPVMVFINEQNFFSISATRGMGPIDNNLNNNTAAHAVINVFAFRDRADVQGLSALTADPDLTVTRKADPDNANCLLDNAADYYSGYPMMLSKSGQGFLVSPGTGSADGETEETGAEEIIYYSAKYTEVGYNFFAYYIDDCPVKNKVRTADRIAFDIDIDGTQDVMCGMAPKLTTVLDANEAFNKLTETEKSKIRNIGNYSTYAAHRNINPMVNLTHRLTRLKFKAYAGDQKASDIVIKAITVKSKTGLKMTAASFNDKQTGLLKHDIALTLRDGDTYDSPDNWGWCKLRGTWTEEGGMPEGIEPVKAPDWTGAPNNKNNVPVGSESGLMVYPATYYDIEINYTQQMRDEHNQLTDEVRELTSTYRVNVPKGIAEFEAGKSYTLLVAVYGLQNIRIDAHIEGWEDAGDVPVDPDEGEIIP